MHLVSKEQQEQYHEEGYFILEGVIPEKYLRLLRDECDWFIEKINKEMDAANTDVMGINHRNSRYFLHNCVQQRPQLGEFVFSPLMAEVCRATLGENAFLFWNQYVVKCAEVGMKFSWHQDSGYVGKNVPHKPYLTCWCPLDDVNEANGTVYVLPFSRAGGREVIQHRPESGSNDLVGYFGDDPGIPVNAPAGSIVAFTSVTFHRSGPNTTKMMRRVYLPQYSAEPIARPDGTLWGASMPFLENGRIVSRG